MTEKQAKSYTSVQLTNINNIPAALRDLQSWVCWGPRGQGAKAPVNPRTGTLASSTDRTTWGTLGDALSRYIDNGSTEKLLGIGFVFSPDDPFCGIDLDGCRDQKSGAITSEAKAIIEKIDSYSEASPSGTGVHIIVRATIPAGRKRASIEMYSHSRFFCFTGQPINGKREVEARQKQTLELYRTVFGNEPEPQKQKPLDAEDPLLAAVRAIPDGDLLALILRSEPLYKKLTEGDFSSLKKDQSASAADFAVCCLLARYTRLDSSRIDAFFRKTPLYRQKWDKRHGAKTYGARTIGQAIAEVSKSGDLYDPTKRRTDGPRRLSDGTNTDAFIDMTGNSFAWVSHWDTWLRWNGTYWQRGADDDVFNAVRRVSDQLWEEFRQNKEWKELASWAKQSDNYSRQLNIERWARRRLGFSSHDLDQYPHLLACKNGVLDLRTGMLRPGDRSEKLTRGVEWSYVPEAECRVFDKFLSEIMLGDKEMVEYLWRVLGYCLTGETSARAFFILHGIGRNGKSTFARALQTLLGMRAENYAQTARFETFLQSQRSSGGADPDVAGLAGARVVVASEVNPGFNYRLDGARIKQFTGEDWVKARFLYSPEFQFLPVCKIFLVVNHIPKIDETAQALYDRLHYIDFQYRVPDEKLDGMLQWKLLGEMEGILARAVRAAGEWYERLEIAPPAAVLKARETIAVEMDKWGGFWRECCVMGNGLEATHNLLYKEFQRWCEAEGIRRPLSTQSFSRELRQKGFTHFRDRAGKPAWEGIGLRVEEVEL